MIVPLMIEWRNRMWPNLLLMAILMAGCSSSYHRDINKWYIGKYMVVQREYSVQHGFGPTYGYHYFDLYKKPLIGYYRDLKCRYKFSDLETPVPVPDSTFCRFEAERWSAVKGRYIPKYAIDICVGEITRIRHSD